MHASVKGRRSAVLAMLLLAATAQAAEGEEPGAWESFARAAVNVLPPYPLPQGYYIQLEAGYAAFRYLPGKMIALLNWEAVLGAVFLPSESLINEAQLYGGAGKHGLLGAGSMAEVGATLNDRRGPHLDLLVRGWVIDDEEGWGKGRMTVHAQLALGAWNRRGFSSLSVIHRWERPWVGGRVLAHLAYVWNGPNGFGKDEDDEGYAGVGFRYPAGGEQAGYLALGGFVSGQALEASRIYLAPSVIWTLFGFSAMAGVAVDLSPSHVHILHIGLYAFGEPK